MNTERHFFPLALVALALAAALTGCADMAGIDRQSQVRAPESLGLGSGASANGAAPVAIDAHWWRAIGDARLDQLIEQAEQGSPTLRLAQAKLRLAQSSTLQAESANRPQLSLDAEGSHQLFTATSIYPPPLGGTIQDTATVQLEASWNVDLFGRNRAAIEAALGQARAAELDGAAARVALESAVTRTYLRLRALVGQVDVARRTLGQREELLGLVHQRIQAGLDSQVELKQAEAAVPEARRQVEVVQEQFDVTRHALAALVGQPDADLLKDVATLEGVNPLPVPAQLPADLLGRRPDILAARWRVEAADHALDSARAQFYPNINLVAFAGYSSIGFDHLWQNNSQQWGVGPAINLPLFNGGRLRANLRARAAEQDELIENYNSTVIEAVHEVLDQMTVLQSVARQQEQQRAAQDAAETAYRLSRQRYEAGLGSYLQVLSAETAVLEQRRLAVDLQARYLDTQVALIRALGGGQSATNPA